MNKEFVPYEEALALKELEFDEPCLGLFHNDKSFYSTQCISHEQYHGQVCSAPLYQQAFRWFREKYSLEGWVTPLVDWQGFVFKYQSRFHKEGFSVAVVGDYDLKEQAELECLKKLIEIIKNK
jgi:hypothetical protein